MTAPPYDMNIYAQKQKRRFPQLSLRSRSFNTTVSTNQQASAGAAQPLEDFVNSRHKAKSFDVSSRPSVGSSQGALPVMNNDTQLTPPTSISRPSDSSLHDNLDGYAGLDGQKSSNTFFKIRRKKKQPEHLFPLPVRLPPPKSLVPATPNADAPLPSYGHQSMPQSSESLPFSVQPMERSSSFAGVDRTRSAMPPFPHSTTAPVSSRFPMLRHDSSTSTRSARSSPGLVPTAVRSFRGRSSTLSSTNDWLDEDPIPTPAWTESGRNSMASATFGRNSVSGLRSLTSRFRNPSDLTSPQRSRQVTPGTSNGPSQHNSFALSRDTIIVSPREDGETAGKYFARIEKDIPKKSIALLMSRSSDTFTHDVLRSLMRTFKFFEEPMDMSIRRFLWEIALPSEAQQIDRVISAFAERYHECNPHIFDKSGGSNSTSQMIHMLINGKDQAYLAAYSLVILHSDLFNKNNKRKMQRSEYQKNTGGHGIHEEVLGYFYDNIQYTEFIAQNADNDDPEAKSKNQARRMKKMRSMIAAGDSGRNPNLDPYDFIIDGSLKLDILRPALKDVLTLEDTFNYRGTIEKFDVRALHSSFCRSGILQIVSARSRPDAFTSPTTITNPQDGHPGVVDIKVVKVGLLWRKDVSTLR